MLLDIPFVLMQNVLGNTKHQLESEREAIQSLRRQLASMQEEQEAIQQTLQKERSMIAEQDNKVHSTCGRHIARAANALATHL